MPLTAHGEQSALRSHRTPNTAASTAPLPASVTIMIRPSCGVGCESSRFDLGQREQIFFGKSEIKDSTRLSTNRPTGKSLEPVQQIPPYAQAAQLARTVWTNVSRTRCSVLQDAPQSRDLYCHLLPCEVDPGSAAHRCALRRVRGTTGAPDDRQHRYSEKPTSL